LPHKLKRGKTKLGEKKYLKLKEKIVVGSSCLD